MTESGETVGFIADGEDVKHVFHSKSNDPTSCKRWGLAYRFDEESTYTPYITSEDMMYVKSASVIARTAVYISAGASEDYYLYDVPLEKAENITLGETVSAVFSKELTKDLKAGDNVKICVSFEHNDGEDLTWRIAAYRDGEEVPFEIKKGRLSDCDAEFDIPDSGDYIFRLINYSTNPVTVASAEIETER